jgi:hypothetical protein
MDLTPLIEFIKANPTAIVIGGSLFIAFYAAEKIVKVTKNPWDDILIDGIRAGVKKLVNLILFRK